MRLRRGFTLIELLVVIAIIGILAAMLFPVFARARESARKIQCLSNVKNIAMAIQMYLTDYDKFPPIEHDANTLAYFDDSSPGGGSWDPSALPHCNKAFLANPYLRWPVIFDEYIKNRDVWRCPSAQVSRGPGWIVPDYGRGWVNALKITEGNWGRDDSDCTGGPCCVGWASGWGGTVTDSIKQNLQASVDTNYCETTIACPQLYDVSMSQVADPVNLIVVADATGSANLTGVESVLYELLPNGDWSNCSWTQDCSLDKGIYDEFWGDANYRARWMRHLGGSNLGFADGHAKWWKGDALEAAAPYCECCSEASGYSGSTMYSEGRPVTGLCPWGVDGSGPVGG
jgi:prepilin-type N-terminal cleavage/methylation domain-containing protein/prepilin-type processing-associated H-X9-DG protein